MQEIIKLLNKTTEIRTHVKYCLQERGVKRKRGETWNGVSTVTDGESTVRDGVPAQIGGVSTMSPYSD